MKIHLLSFVISSIAFSKNATITLPGGSSAQTINKAIASNTRVVLSKGEYYLNARILIHSISDFSLEGNGSTILNITNTLSEPAIHIRGEYTANGTDSKYITINNLKIKYKNAGNADLGKSGITIDQADYVTISNCEIFYAPGRGIVASKVNNNVISDNYIENSCYDGIQLGLNNATDSWTHADNNVITRNNIYNCGINCGCEVNGIFITADFGSIMKDDTIKKVFVTYGTISKNIISNNDIQNCGDVGIESGIHSYATIIDGNCITNAQKTGIIARDNNQCTISNNTIIKEFSDYSGGGGGALIMDSQIQEENRKITNAQAVITGNTITGIANGSCSAIEIRRLSNLHIIGNSITYGNHGIAAAGSTNITIYNNHIQSTAHGIAFYYGGSNSTVKNNTLELPTGIAFKFHTGDYLNFILDSNTVTSANQYLYLENVNGNADLRNSTFTNTLFPHAVDHFHRHQKPSISIKKEVIRYTFTDKSSFLKLSTITHGMMASISAGDESTDCLFTFDGRSTTMIKENNVIGSPLSSKKYRIELKENKVVSITCANGFPVTATFTIIYYR